MKLLSAILILAACFTARAATFVGEWIPKFKGIDYSVSTNTPGTGGVSTRRQVVHALRVDLQDPDVRLFTTPRYSSYAANSREIGALTVSDFLRTYELQAVINANFFSERQYYLSAFTPMDVYGLLISTGEVVSAQNNAQQAATIVFTEDNQPTVIHTNWPARSTEGIFTAVSGDTALVVAGRNIGRVTDVEPRTAFGVSEDRRYLFLVAIDGRQSGYSDGSTDLETANWMIRLGAYDAVNMDGGGSTTLSVADSTGAPLRMNSSSAVEDSGRERTVGSHLGIYAKPLPGFFNDVTANAADTTAAISFTTIRPASATLAYGPTTNLGLSASAETSATTDHHIELSSLLRGSGYYYRLTAGENISPLFFFKTSNTVTTNLVFTLTNEWKFFAGQTVATNWTQPAFDDRAWGGPGAGMLWADSRATPPASVVPRNTQMPLDPATGFPYVTYYFRTAFPLDDPTWDGSLTFSTAIDDGAVFYLNGTEIHRLRMPATSTSQTIASGFPCTGDANCRDEFTIRASSFPGLFSTNNVLAVEVHNYNIRSADITFGLELSRLDPVAAAPRTIQVQSLAAGIELSWEGTATLQWSPNPDGPWTNSTSTVSPVLVTPSETKRFYRLRN